MATNGNDVARTELMDGLGDELLAGPRLAGDQHRRAGRRRLLDDMVDLPHLAAVADHRPERAVLAQLTAQRLDLAQRLLPLDNLVEQDLQPLDVDRLGQVVVGALLHGLDRRLDGALRGQQQRRDVGALRLKRPQQTQPVHARHDQVGDDDGGTEGGHLLERVLAVGGRIGEKSPALDQLLEADARGVIVLDDQHPLGERLGGRRV